MPNFNLKATLLMACCSIFSVSSFATETSNINDHISLQMFTLRNVGDTESQLSMANKAGFENVEIVGNQGLDANNLNALLKTYALKVSGAHVQLADLENNYDATVKFNKSIGNNILIMPWLAPSLRPTTRDGWIELGKKLDTLGAKLKKDKMIFAYHNHNFEMKKFGNKTAMDLILENSKPENLSVEFDAAWISRGGQDPVNFIRKYKDRIIAIHAKDNTGIGIRDSEMNFAPVGEGIMDWNSIVQEAEKDEVPLYVIEHDAPLDPYAIITTGLDNLKEKMEAVIK